MSRWVIPFCECILIIPWPTDKEHLLVGAVVCSIFGGDRLAGIICPSKLHTVQGQNILTESIKYPDLVTIERFEPYRELLPEVFVVFGVINLVNVWINFNCCFNFISASSSFSVLSRVNI
jgi:hypothetical protein